MSVSVESICAQIEAINTTAMSLIENLQRERNHYRDALQTIVDRHERHCEQHVGVSSHSYTLAGLARESLAEWKG